MSATQSTSHIFMVRPSVFYANPQTASNNFFQKTSQENTSLISQKAQQEFDALVSVLRTEGVQVYVWQNPADSDTPDAVFPNNWVSFHYPNTRVIYPMFAPNRRIEIRSAPLKMLENQGFKVNSEYDFSSYVSKNLFLEGTGSMVLDRVHKKAYCALSERCDKELVDLFCEKLGYQPVIFHAYQTHLNKRMPIYHTNVMMCIGTDFAIVGLDTVDDLEERDVIHQNLLNDGKEVIAISEFQIHAFAGNMMEVCNAEGRRFLVMSETAFKSLSKKQIQRLERYVTPLYSPLDTIEQLGGGSARCMMAAVFN